MLGGPCSAPADPMNSRGSPALCEGGCCSAGHPPAAAFSPARLSSRARRFGRERVPSLGSPPLQPLPPPQSPCLHALRENNNGAECGAGRLVERSVVVAKQQNGYGLTVSGEHPVFVDSVHPDGAAARAGVREGDQIVKINGMPVSSSNHFEVLRMISGGCWHT